MDATALEEPRPRAAWGDGAGFKEQGRRRADEQRHTAGEAFPPYYCRASQWRGDILSTSEQLEYYLGSEHAHVRATNGISMSMMELLWEAITSRCGRGSVTLEPKAVAEATAAATRRACTAFFGGCGDIPQCNCFKLELSLPHTGTLHTEQLWRG